MCRKLHNHGFNELAEGLVYKGKVIVDVDYKDLFTSFEVYDRNHVIVNFDEFKALGGEVKFVKISNS